MPAASAGTPHDAKEVNNQWGCRRGRKPSGSAAEAGDDRAWDTYSVSGKSSGLNRESYPAVRFDAAQPLPTGRFSDLSLGVTQNRRELAEHNTLCVWWGLRIPIGNPASCRTILTGSAKSESLVIKTAVSNLRRNASRSRCAAKFTSDPFSSVLSTKTFCGGLLPVTTMRTEWVRK